MDGKVFAADVYSVLAAFGVKCPARQHAIKKLLMPGQRGAKSTVQDLDEALVSVSRAIDMVRAGLPEGGTLTGETEPEPEPNLVTWRLCVRIHPWQISDRLFANKWYPSGSIPEHWCPIEAQSGPIETIRQLPEGQQP